jgi:MFS family permease
MAAGRIRQTEGAWRIVWLLSVAFAINYVDRQFLFAVFPRLHRDLALSNTQLGLVGSVFTWTYAASMPLAGYLADHFPRHRLIISALLLWSLATLGTSLSMDATQLLFWRAIMGFTEALYLPAAIGMIADAHPGLTRSRALSIHGFAQFVGLTIGGFYGGWAADRIGWRNGSAFLTAVGICYAGVLIWGFWRFDSRPAKPRTKSSSALSKLLSPSYMLLSLTFIAFCAMLWVIYVWLPTFIHDRYRLTLAESGLTSTLYLQAGSAVGVLLGGILGDWAGRRYKTGRFDVALGGILCCAPFALLIFSTHSLLVLEATAVGFGLCSGFFIANVFSSLYDIVMQNNFGIAVGMLNMLGGIGAGIAILLAGIAKNSWGIAALMLWTSAGAAAAALTLLIVVHTSLKAMQGWNSNLPVNRTD